VAGKLSELTPSGQVGSKEIGVLLGEQFELAPTSRGFACFLLGGCKTRAPAVGILTPANVDFHPQAIANMNQALVSFGSGSIGKQFAGLLNANFAPSLSLEASFDEMIMGER